MPCVHAHLAALCLLYADSTLMPDALPILPSPGCCTQNPCLLQVFNEITKAQPESEKINGKYRIAALVVLFGLYAVIAIFVGGLGALGRTPRTTSAFLLLFWLLTGFILVLGAGLPPLS